ncbi:unnamed protein product [Parnassius mnemosyne]|uniref:(+)RNA virus helicase C-terminal domain-containing protein n=1 Tax=Parnassius mnemosyne TaxID=213953 RepID=A0AAV1KYV8_9NEOP
MLEDKILDRLKAVSITLEEGGTLGHWQLPKITWVNGVPGCGKTSWVINSFEAEKDIIITTTTVAASDLRERLASRVGADAARKVRTMASILVNGITASEKYTRLLTDEALMNHFGAIVMAVQITGASEIFLIGDNNQLPYIDRHDLFRLHYTRPNLVANINHEWLCTHRYPLDVAYALNEIYEGIYSSNTRLQSLELKSYTGSQIPKSLENTLFLGHTQAEKENLISQGYGKGKGSRTLTIHETQGLVSETVVIVRSTREQQRLYNSIPHAVVAIARHTRHCTYFTDWCEEDAVARFILRAESVTTSRVRDYNIKTAIYHRDLKVANNIMNLVRDEVA